MEQRTDRRAHQPPENIEEGHVWKGEIRLVEIKSLGWIEARRRAETVINNCDAPIRRGRLRQVGLPKPPPRTRPGQFASGVGRSARGQGLREPKRVSVRILNVELARAPRLIDRAFMDLRWRVRIAWGPQAALAE